MKVLQLCKKVPYPLKDGESVAVTYLSRALHHLGAQIDLLTMNTSKHFVDIAEVRHHMSQYSRIEEVYLDNGVKPLHAFFNLFTSDSYNIARFDISDFAEKLRELLVSEYYDVVQLESLYLAPYIPTIRQHSNAKVVLRAHNVEHEIWKRLAKNADQVLKKWYLDHCARKLKKYEIDQLQQVDLLLPISTRDTRKFKRLGYSKDLQCLPIGLDMDQYPFELLSSNEKLSLSFIGSLDWMPNVEGLNWFLTQIWPNVLSVFPNLELHVAGRNCPDWLRQIEMPNIHIHGEVESSQEFLLAHPITIVPLLSGSGMRVKILEAMALGRVVISTELGLEGIKVRDKKNALIANKVDDFIRKITFCYNHKKHLQNISLNARKFVAKQFDYVEVVRQAYGQLT